MPFAAPAEPVVNAVPAIAASVPNSAWQINVAEIVTEKATLALRDQAFNTPQAATAKLDLTVGAAIVTGEKLSIRASGTRVLLSEITLRDEAAKDAWLAVKEVRCVVRYRCDRRKNRVTKNCRCVAAGHDGARQGRA